MYTVPQLKQAARILAKTFELSEADARQKITELNKENPDTVLDILAGKIPDILEKNCRSIKNFPESKTGSRPARSKRSTTTATDHAEREHSQTITAPLETVQGEIVEDYKSGELPAGLAETIEDYLEDFKHKYNLDLEKCSGTQWRAACIYIGQRLQKSGVLLDHKRMREHGGKVYNAELIAALIPYWEYLTSLYRHVPLHGDFISFVGVSGEWFTDSREALTSTRVGVRKRLQEIEERALSAALADHRENPTGRIYYTKARLGWRESVEIVHTSAAAVSGLDDIPKLTDNNN